MFCRLKGDPRPEVRAAGTNARRGVEQLHSLYKAHVERWDEEQVTNRWSEFQGAVRTMVLRMTRKIDHEEVDLFPLVANDDRGVTAAGSRA